MTAAVTQITLKGLRCWDQLSWQPDPGVNLLTGNNGAGKTSLLEAVYMVLQLRPPSGVRWGELIPSGAENAFVGGRVDGDDVRIGFTHSERQVRIDDHPVRQLDRLLQQRPVIPFAPADLALVQGGPKGRRRLLDQIAFALFVEHADLARRYAQALQARNALLRSRRPDPELLSVWTYELARYGCRVIEQREEAAAALAPHLVAAYTHLAGGRETLSTQYRPTVGPGEQREERLLEAIERSLGRDKRVHHTTVGPHAEDWQLDLDQRLLRSGASQGQQRSAVLALRLAQVALASERGGATPTLLLDDIAGELDGERSAALFERLLDGQGQVFVTATSASEPVLTAARSVRQVRVSAGTLEGE
jgi:DNA replication and repair protein RecF